MPCNSDYLEPTRTEIEHHRAAKLIVYVHSKMGIHTAPWVRDIAEGPVNGSADREHWDDWEKLIPGLCAALRELPSEERERIVYNAHDPMSRDLAYWWEEHEAADRERETLIAAASRKTELIQSARAKLTPAEIEALGLQP